MGESGLEDLPGRSDAVGFEGQLRRDGSFGSTDNTYGASGNFQYATGNGAWVFGYCYLKLKFSAGDRNVDLKL